MKRPNSADAYTLAPDQLVFLVTFAYGTPDQCRGCAVKYGGTSSMIALRECSLIEPCGNGYEITQKGLILLDAMRALPLPVPTTGWRMP
jgi:hypothetical protein